MNEELMQMLNNLLGSGQLGHASAFPDIYAQQRMDGAANPMFREYDKEADDNAQDPFEFMEENTEEKPNWERDISSRQQMMQHALRQYRS